MPTHAVTVTIINKKGLHARAAAKFVKTVAKFDATVSVTRLGELPEGLDSENLGWTVSGSSILGLMMLAAEPGTQLELKAEGGQAVQVLEALDVLINNCFEEGE